jgi:uncharacterized protein YjbJ (UPF0337 family)
MAGVKNRIVGKAREIKGRITKDESEELAGKVQQEEGKLESKATRVKRKVIAKTEAIVDKVLE